ncbi:MAG: JDVT-CTERM system glutamic-type intramembrane protease [Thermodesulfobacteriota bacterium]|nr:JDVT-CTERM system glutamic-type intramembrane protease [Thermodesulfobacteriota bacterium]
MVFYCVVVMAAFICNQVSHHICFLFIAACLILPIIGGRPEALKSFLALRRQGWVLVGLIVLMGLCALYAGLIGLVKGYLRAMFLHPEVSDTVNYLVEHAILVIPLALAEEVFFRGYLQENVFRNLWGQRCLGPLTSKNLISALLFGLAHSASYLSPIELTKVCSGLALGWVVERSGGSIWPAVALHAVSNIALSWSKLLIGLNIPWL